MKTIKSIVAGVLFILATIFSMGLIYIFIAVGYNSLAADYSFLKQIDGFFRYLLVIPAFMVTMFFGGYITASVAKVFSKAQVLFHTVVVAVITIGIMMYSALENSNLTLTGIILFILAICSSVAGGYFWLKSKATSEDN